MWGKKKTVVISGGFDPIHCGHVRLIQEAATYGKLYVVMNNDNWLMKKKGFVFMPQEERAEIVVALKGVKDVIITSHDKECTDMSVAKELAQLKPDIFCNGGDRKEGCVPTAEEEVCKELGIEMRYNVGGEKIQSSSWLVERAKGTQRTILEIS